MRATIAIAVAVMMGCASVSQSQIREPAGPAEARAQLALLAVLMFRGDVARGESAVDRCTATLHGGAATMLRLPAAIPGVRV
ncbi:MAG TPA: hypothetical protein VHQ45_04605, partial [Gemmatimonadaceae bacterium]|nr:hypothetical protein [Gemmatimonadaceae bacterium]